MRVTVMGANGKVGRRVLAGLVADGHEVTGMVRSAEQVEQVESAGARAVVADLLDDVSNAVEGAEAVVFAAGAAFGGDPDSIDGEGCIAAQKAAVAAGVRPWVQVSSLMADRPEQGPPPLLGFLRAKQRSDDALADSGLTWTVVRPGGLLEGEPSGTITVGTDLDSVAITRADVASTVVSVVTHELAADRGFDLVAGPTPIEDALRAL